MLHSHPHRTGSSQYRTGKPAGLGHLRIDVQRIEVTRRSAVQRRLLGRRLLLDHSVSRALWRRIRGCLGAARRNLRRSSLARNFHDKAGPFVVAEFLPRRGVDRGNADAHRHTAASVNNIDDLGGGLQCGLLGWEWMEQFQEVLAVNVIVRLEIREKGGHGLGDSTHDGNNGESPECWECMKERVAFVAAREVRPGGTKGDIIGDYV